MLFCEFCKISKNTFSTEQLQTPAFGHTQYFNQYFNLYFATDTDYIFFAKSIYEHHLHSPINSDMHKIKQATVKNNLKGIIGKFVASDDAFSFMSSVNQRNTSILKAVFVRSMVKQLEITTYFLTLPYAEPRWEELPYIINKSSNLGLGDKEFKNLSNKERCNLPNYNPALVAKHFQYKVEVFFKEIILDGPLGKTKCDAVHIKFQEGGSHISIFQYRLSMHKKN